MRAKVKEALAALDGPQAPADDQKAMLRLLAQREEGYDDIAALTGQSVEDVRAKVSWRARRPGGVQSPAARRRSSSSPQPAAPMPPPPPEPKPAPEPAPRRQAPKPRPGPKPAGAEGGPARLKLPEDRGAVWGLGAGLASS